MSFRSALKLVVSTDPSVERGGSERGFGFGFTGGGVLVRCFSSGPPSLGSGGSLMARLGFGERTGVGLACETGRVCSNMLTRELVGGIGVSSVGLSMPACSARATATGSGLASSLLVPVDTFCCLESSLASTLPTLPGGGRTSRSFAALSDMTGTAEGWDMGFIGLCLAAASFAAMFEGEGTGEREVSSGTARLLELLDLPSIACQSSFSWRACCLRVLSGCMGET